MSDDIVKIACTQNGPLYVQGAVSVTDFDGTAIKVTGAGIALCRCGASNNKPFCDGSHISSGFDGTLSDQNKG